MQVETSWKSAPEGPHAHNELIAQACYRPCLPDGPTVYAKICRLLLRNRWN
jgi:hypothetical protein